MPLYHYRCRSCGARSEQLVHTNDGAVVTAVRCPSCGSADQERELTSFHVGGRVAASQPEPFCGRCGENRPPCSAD